MRKLYGSDDFVLIGQLRSVLESHHIRCVVRNEHLIGGAGELPPNECWPEIWVAEDFQLDRARELLQAFLPGAQKPGSAWSCPTCAEPIEGQFTECWSCGTSRPPAAG